jgi:hypothetical protein
MKSTVLVSMILALFSIAACGDETSFAEDVSTQTQHSDAMSSNGPYGHWHAFNKYLGLANMFIDMEVKVHHNNTIEMLGECRVNGVSKNVRAVCSIEVTPTELHITSSDRGDASVNGFACNAQCSPSTFRFQRDGDDMSMYSPYDHTTMHWTRIHHH